MIKTTTIRKSKHTTDYISDITKAFTILSNKKNLYHITIEGIPTPHMKDWSFQLTHKLFNVINKDYKSSMEYFNYLYIGEYGGIISKQKVFNNQIENLGIHAHCIINTSLSVPQLEYYIKTAFKKNPNCDIQDISKSTTKGSLLDYLLKQEKTKLMTSDSYNYKITL